MRKLSLAIMLLLCVGVAAGCSDKKAPSEKAKETAGLSADSAVERPAEVKEAAPPALPENKDEAAKKKAPAPSVAKQKALKEPIAAGNGVEVGAALFKSKCLPCHGADGKGTAMAPAFKGNSWVKGASKGETAKVIKEGRQGGAKKYTSFAVGMPAFKDMPDADIDALAEYIRSIN